MAQSGPQHLQVLLPEYALVPDVVHYAFNVAVGQINEVVPVPYLGVRCHHMPLLRPMRSTNALLKLLDRCMFFPIDVIYLDTALRIYEGWGWHEALAFIFLWI